MITSMRGCVAYNDLWPWPLSSRSFGLGLENCVRSVPSTVHDGFFPYFEQMITSMRRCVACDDLWTWPISSRSLYPRPTKLEGGYTGFTLSVRLSVCPSVCRRHGFRSISQVCFGISISNFICMLMVAIGRSLLIFSDVTFKMAAWRPYWIFWFPDSNFTSALNINFKLQRHNTYVYG